MDFATRIFEGLVEELGTTLGPCERVMKEVSVSDVTKEEVEAIFEMTEAAILELRRTWGPTANPRLLRDIIQKGETEDSGLESEESDHKLAVYGRAGVLAYVRLIARDAPDSAKIEHLRLVFGVVQDMTRYV